MGGRTERVGPNPVQQLHKCKREVDLQPQPVAAVSRGWNKPASAGPGLRRAAAPHDAKRGSACATYNQEQENIAALHRFENLSAVWRL